MRRKTSRPPTLGVGRAGSSKGLGGTFDSQDRETLNQEQDDDRLLVPDAHRRIVFGRRARIVGRRPPPEYKEPEGDSYRLILGPEPACFTRRGIRSADAKAAMARTGISTSVQVLIPRRAFISERGD